MNLGSKLHGIISEWSNLEYHSIGGDANAFLHFLFFDIFYGSGIEHFFGSCDFMFLPLRYEGVPIISFTCTLKIFTRVTFCHKSGVSDDSHQFCAVCIIYHIIVDAHSAPDMTPTHNLLHKKISVLFPHHHSKK